MSAPVPRPTASGSSGRSAAASAGQRTGSRRTACGTATRRGWKGAELHQMQHSAGRVNTRCLQRSVRPYGALSVPGHRRGCDDLGQHRPPGPGATLLHLMRLRDMHPRCVCCGHDASGAPWLHRMHHRRPGERRPAGAHRYEERAVPPAHCSPHAPDLATGRSGCTGCIIAAREADSRAAPARPSATRHADAPPGGGRARHAPRLPIAHPPGLDRYTAELSRTRDHQL